MQIRMVSAGIYEELALLCCFFLVGVFLAACYDVLRILRGIIPHGTFLVNLEDLVYWIYVAVVVFVELYDKNDGRLRGYVFGGLLAGMILYACSFGRFCVPYTDVVIPAERRTMLATFMAKAYRSCSV